MTDRKLVLLILAAIAAAILVHAAALAQPAQPAWTPSLPDGYPSQTLQLPAPTPPLAQTPTGDATFPPGTAVRPAPLPPRPGLAQPSDQVPMPRKNFDPSQSTGKPEDCVDGTVWSPSLRGCMPPWHAEPAPPDK